ncbi:MAG: DUF898 domain-containing protein [Proteobacteria bacterium]|nr:DUF898 domain-containing protein [Pseudomonadota bacterium]
METVSSPEEEALPEYGLEFDGSFRGLLPIVLVNLLLTIITLGLYRFWARTKVRKYLWSSVRLHGDAFEYTGTGKELFIGFLIVLFLVFLPMGFAFFQAQIMMETPGREAQGASLLFGAYMLMLYLYGVAYYRRNRYRLSRTRWRGIRGKQREGGYRYGFIHFMLTLVNFMLLGLASPLISNRLWEYESNRREFGTGRFSYKGRAGPLYKPFAIAVFLSLLLIAATVTLIIFVIAAVSGGGGATEWLQQSQANGPKGIYTIVAALFAGYFLVGLAVAAPVLWYQVRQLRHFWGHSRYEGFPLSFHGRFGDIFRLWLGNLGIFIATLGLGAPFMEMRWLRFLVEHTRISGFPALESIGQAEGADPSLGEGLAEGFDLGGI